MTELTFCPTEPAGQITFKYATKEDVIKIEQPPIYLKEESRFLEPALGMWGETTLTESSAETWLNFFTLPAGYSQSDYENDLYSGKHRQQVSYQPSFNDRWTYYYNNQPIFEVEANSYGAFGQEFISKPGDKEALLNLLNLFFPGRFLRIYTDFVPGLIWKFAEVRNGWRILKYKTDFNLGEYIYSVSCGGCPEGTFQVQENNSQGYICVPYEDIINWSKQQRQRLNQIARNLK